MEDIAQYLAKWDTAAIALSHSFHKHKTPLVIVGLLLKFTIVEMRGPNKTLDIKTYITSCYILTWLV